MIIFGQILIVVGFMLGTLSTAFDKEEVKWPMFAAAMAVGIVGILMAAMGRRREAHSEDRLTTNLSAIGTALGALAQKVRDLEKRKETLKVDEVHQQIDLLFPQHLANFVEARESVIHAYSLNDYANLMNHFAAGERTLNRVWSASVDGYIDEVHLCLKKAAQHFDDAWSLYRQLETRKS